MYSVFSIENQRQQYIPLNYEYKNYTTDLRILNIRDINEYKTFLLPLNSYENKINYEEKIDIPFFFPRSIGYSLPLIPFQEQFVYINQLINEYSEDIIPENNRIIFTSLKDPSLIKEECPICYEEMKIDEEKNNSEFEPIILENCSHIFHKGCIQNACKVKQVCPMCRANIR